MFLHSTPLLCLLADYCSPNEVYSIGRFGETCDPDEHVLWPWLAYLTLLPQELQVEVHKSLKAKPAPVLSVVSDQLVCDRTRPQHGWISSGVPCARKGLPTPLFMADTLVCQSLFNSFWLHAGIDKGCGET